MFDKLWVVDEELWWGFVKDEALAFQTLNEDFGNVSAEDDELFDCRELFHPSRND